MAKLNVQIPKQCEKDEIVTIDTPIRPCCLQMTRILVDRNDAIKHDDERNYNSLCIDNGYWIPMFYCPYCGKKIENADSIKTEKE